MGGPEMAPQTPQRSARPGEPVTRLERLAKPWRPRHPSVPARLVIFWVEQIAEAVAREVERQRQREDRESRPPRHPRRRLEELLRGVEHRAPARRGRLHAQPEEREHRLRDDRDRNRDRGLYEERADDVRQDVTRHQAQVAGPERAGALHVVLGRRREHEAAREADVCWRRAQSDRNRRVGERGAHDRHEPDGEDQEGEGQPRVRQPHEHLVQRAAIVAGDETERHADGGGEQDQVLMRLTDAWLAFPFLILAIGLVTIMGPSLTNATIAIGLGATPTYIRLTRGLVLSTAAEDYVQGAQIGRASCRERV